MRLLILDTDTIIYRIALRGQDDTFDIDPDFPPYISESDYEDMYRAIQSEIKTCLFESSCFKVRCYLTGTENFRRDFLPSYKWRRGQKPIAYARLVEMVMERMDNAYRIEGEEADDSCCRDFSTVEHFDNNIEIVQYTKVLGHIDKDLNQVAGEHYGYMNNGVAKGLYHVTQTEADNFLWYQVLAGDTADCYKGCPNVGGNPRKSETDKGRADVGGKAMEIVQGTLCVRPIVNVPKKGKNAGIPQLKWEEYHDKSLGMIDKLMTWFIKGAVTKGFQGHISGFDTTSGFEDDVKIPLEITTTGAYMDKDNLDKVFYELNLQYQVAYMLRSGESIPTKLHKIK